MYTKHTESRNAMQRESKMVGLTGDVSKTMLKYQESAGRANETQEIADADCKHHQWSTLFLLGFGILEKYGYFLQQILKHFIEWRKGIKPIYANKS